MGFVPHGKRFAKQRAGCYLLAMNCLPVVDRELRVAARKRNTFWLRVGAAITGVLIGSACFLLTDIYQVGTAQVGSVLFAVLTWACLIVGLSAGLFFTSDCLSEEKREGTLGLLFLTELRGYDVALGKLLATSLRGFYALLAVLPIVAITQLMGGISGAQYWKSSLAIVNGLFVSLAAGLFISAVSRDSQKALAGTFGMVLLLSAGGPLFDELLSSAKPGNQTFWSVSSPAFALAAASEVGRTPYWAGLAISNLIGWTLLVAACALVPRSWQDKQRVGPGPPLSFKYENSTKYRARRALMERNPVTWLGCLERWQARIIWGIGLLCSAGFAALLAVGQSEYWFFWYYLGGVLPLILYLCAASQSSRFLAEARRSGFLELMLVSPLSHKQIVSGHWRALRRMFGWPVLLILGLCVAGSCLAQLSYQRIISNTMAGMTTTGTTNLAGASAGTNQATNWVISTTTTQSVTVNVQPLALATSVTGISITAWHAVGVVVSASVGAAAVVGNLLALCWFGLWMGLTSKTANLATLKTILFVQVIPYCAITMITMASAGLFIGLMSVKMNSPATWLLWFPLVSAVLSATIALIKDAGFIVWSRKKLLSAFREQATRTPGQPHFTEPSPVATVPAPPVLPAQT